MIWVNDPRRAKTKPVRKGLDSLERDQRKARQLRTSRIVDMFEIWAHHRRAKTQSVSRSLGPREKDLRKARQIRTGRSGQYFHDVCPSFPPCENTSIRRGLGRDNDESKADKDQRKSRQIRTLKRRYFHGVGPSSQRSRNVKPQS